MKQTHSFIYLRKQPRSSQQTDAVCVHISSVYAWKVNTMTDFLQNATETLTKSLWAATRCCAVDMADVFFSFLYFTHITENVLDFI